MSEDDIILTHILQCRPIDLVVNKPVLTPVQQKQFKEYQHRRKNGEPLQYILGTCNFMGLELKVTPAVLVPRPETEQMVDEVLKTFKGGRVLDLGTGSGNIAIALAKFVPHTQVITVDVSAKAVAVARANVKRHGVEHHVKCIESDMAVILRSAEDMKFDLIISNPPYVPTMQLSHLPKDVQQEPALALNGGQDGLDFYRILIKYTPGLLSTGACLMMEFGDGQADAIRAMLAETQAFLRINVGQDLAGRDRFVQAIRI